MIKAKGACGMELCEEPCEEPYGEPCERAFPIAVALMTDTS